MVSNNSTRRHKSVETSRTFRRRRNTKITFTRESCLGFPKPLPNFGKQGTDTLTLERSILNILTSRYQGETARDIVAIDKSAYPFEFHVSSVTTRPKGFLKHPNTGRSKHQTINQIISPSPDTHDHKLERTLLGKFFTYSKNNNASRYKRGRILENVKIKFHWILKIECLRIEFFDKFNIFKLNFYNTPRFCNFQEFKIPKFDPVLSLKDHDDGEEKRRGAVAARWIEARTRPAGDAAEPKGKARLTRSEQSTKSSPRSGITKMPAPLSRPGGCVNRGMHGGKRSRAIV